MRVSPRASGVRPKFQSPRGGFALAKTNQARFRTNCVNPGTFGARTRAVVATTAGHRSARRAYCRRAGGQSTGSNPSYLDEGDRSLLAGFISQSYCASPYPGGTTRSNPVFWTTYCRCAILSNTQVPEGNCSSNSELDILVGTKQLVATPRSSLINF